jgi:hypothetical protein
MNHVFNKLIRRGDDESVALKIRCTSCSTTGEVTINDTKIVLNEDGTKSTFDLSTDDYDTLGELADAVNAKDNWEAVIVDGLRSMDVESDTMDMVGPAGTLTGSETMGATGSDGVSFGWDSSVTHQYVVAVQEEDLPSKAATAGKSDVEDKAIENVAYEIKAKLTDTNCTNTLNIYRCVGTTETLVHTITGTATSDEQTLFSSDTVPITAGNPETGGRLVSILTCDTTHGSTFLEVRGQSINRVRQAIDGD